MMNPLHILRNHRSFQNQVAEEVNFQIERHGDDAINRARRQLADDRLDSEQRRILQAAIRRLGR